VGRHFHFGSLDCYGLVRDFYARELDVELMDFERTDRFWDRGEDLYMENFAKAGFQQVKKGPIFGDVLLMQYRSKVANHGGVFIGGASLRSMPELVPVHDAMIHHLSPRLSERVVYGGHWAEITRAIVRHKSRMR
jgi:cell wall-associated NlpC family hydrolase